MKIFSAPSAPLTRSQAMNCLVLNLLATPGLGTLIGKRKPEGLCQLTLAVIGFGMIVGWFVTLFLNFYREMHQQPDLPMKSWLGWVGLTIFAAAWFWSLASSLYLLRTAQG